jgi:hypothetical protein
MLSAPASFVTNALFRCFRVVTAIVCYNIIVIIFASFTPVHSTLAWIRQSLHIPFNSEHLIPHVFRGCWSKLLCILCTRHMSKHVWDIRGKFFHVIISAVHYLIFWLFLTLEVEQFSFLNSVLAVVYRLWHTSMNKCRPV